MEVSKRFYKFFGRPGEDYQLWCARTEAALQAKEVLDVVLNDPFEAGAVEDEATLRAIASSRAIIIEGLGDRPLRLCLSEKENPYRMWIRLRERYAVSNTATKVQLQARLSRTTYQGQSMPDYIDGYEEIFNRLAAMNSAIPEYLQIAMLLASFGDKTQSIYGHVVASLQSIQEEVSWDTVTVRLLQEYEEHISLAGNIPGSSSSGQGQALNAKTASGKSRKFVKSKGSRTERRRCYRCRRIGHLAKDCKMKKYNHEQPQHSDNADEGKEFNDGSAQNAQLLVAREESRSTDKFSRIKFKHAEISVLKHASMKGKNGCAENLPTRCSCPSVKHQIRSGFSS